MTSIPLAFQPASQPPDLSLPDTMKLSRLVDLAGEVSGVAYSYNPQELEQSVTLRVPGGLARKDVPEFLSFVLASRGFTTVRTPGSPVISVVKMEAAAGLARVSKDAGDSG
ncbi:MAG: hypothetical protein JNL50_05860, partial [Phycisphaerae bacterium]|nr:hypothetical protein [Phycisphaerae bacterium]